MYYNLTCFLFGFLIASYVQISYLLIEISIVRMLCFVSRKVSQQTSFLGFVIKGIESLRLNQ
jgi:uncharacterized membrane protein YuzA (DUF378 family)